MTATTQTYMQRPNPDDPDAPWGRYPSGTPRSQPKRLWADLCGAPTKYGGRCRNWRNNCRNHQQTDGPPIISLTSTVAIPRPAVPLPRLDHQILIGIALGRTVRGIAEDEGTPASNVSRRLGRLARQSIVIKTPAGWRLLNPIPLPAYRDDYRDEYDDGDYYGGPGFQP